MAKRYCHADHLLQAAESVQDGDNKLQQPDSLYVPRAVVASDKSVN